MTRRESSNGHNTDRICEVRKGQGEVEVFFIVMESKESQQYSILKLVNSVGSLHRAL